MQISGRLLTHGTVVGPCDKEGPLCLGPGSGRLPLLRFCLAQDGEEAILHCSTMGSDLSKVANRGNILTWVSPA